MRSSLYLALRQHSRPRRISAPGQAREDLGTILSMVGLSLLTAAAMAGAILF